MAIGLAIAFVILAASGEVIVRTFGQTLIYEPDERLGWKPKADFSLRMTVRDPAGPYEVDYSTGPYGFRAFGNPASGRKRVLVLGDSFTADPNTSNDEAYFGIAAKRLPVEMFAIGGGGFGTLQELLLLREVVARVKPDIFVLQYCTNDISDNSMALEDRTSHVRNQKNLRPYLVGDSIVFRMSKYHPYFLLHANSRLFRKLDIELMKLQYIFDNPEGNAPPAERAAAIALTQRLMGLIVAELPKGTRSLTISCNTSKPEETEAWKAMAAAAGLDAQPSVSGAVEAAEKKGESVRMIDHNHWNRLGNRVAGEELARILAQSYLSASEAVR
jgi:hypothetical protein